MSLEVNVEEIITAFLGLTEDKIDSGKSKMHDYINKQAKNPMPEQNITILGYNAGANTQFELVVDHDEENRVITQRTLIPNAQIVLSKLESDPSSIKSDFLGFGVFEKYIAHLNNKVRFKMVEFDGIPVIQADIFL